MMEQNQNSFKNLWTKCQRWLGSADRWVLIAVLAAICFIGYGLYEGIAKMKATLSTPHEIVLEDTPVSIEATRPRGELYVCTAVVEDYVALRRTHSIAGLFPQQHSCVQMVKQKVGFKIDLDKITYQIDTLNILIVTLPPVEYVASTQDSPFLSDDESYWATQLESTNKLKYRAEQKIRHRFNSEENRRKATRYAEEAIGHLLQQLGYEPRFTPHLEPSTKKRS